MSAELEIIDEYGECTVVTIDSEPYVLSEHALLVRRAADGVRLESTTGVALRIHGENLFSKDLGVGESADVGRLRLRCLSARPANPVVSAPSERMPSARMRSTGGGSGARRGAGDRANSSRRGQQAASQRGTSAARVRSRAKANWLPAAAVTLALLLVAVFLIQRLSKSNWPHSPKHFVELAQIQYDNNKPERALETLAFALKDATGDVREQAQTLDKAIRRMMLLNSGALQVSDARHQNEVLESFAATYLQQPNRPAARECVRLCDVWLERHGEVCSWHPDGMPLAASVRATREQHISLAALQSPETAADVIFAARSRMRFQTRDYKEAWARMDAFLAAKPGDEEVLAERQRLLADGEAWFAKRLRRLDRSLDQGDTNRATDDLAQLDRWAAIPEWLPRLEERRARLTASR